MTPNLSLNDPAFVGAAGAAGASGYTSGLGSSGDLTYSGTGSGSCTSCAPSGLGANALEMSGTSYTAQIISGGQAIPIASDFTFSLWSNLDDFHNALMLYATDGTAVVRIEFTTASGGSIKKLALQFYDKDGAFAELTEVVTTSYTTGVWHLIGVTYIMSTGTLELYVDGALEGDNGGSSATGGFLACSDYKFFILSTEAYDGKATEIVTRNIALPLADWVTLYASGNGVTADTVEQGSILIYWNGQDASDPVENIAIP